MTRRLALSSKVAGGFTYSVPRAYPSGVSLITGSTPETALREDILAIGIQNRDNKPIYFWYGRVSTSLANFNTGVMLPLNPTTWTAQDKLDAALFIKTYGEKIEASARYEPECAHLSPIYALVDDPAAAVAHVKITTSTVPSLV